MRRGSAWRRVHRVPPSERTTLRLAVDLSREPIEGEVQAPTGPVLPFIGWLGLAAALERAVLPSGDGVPGPGPATDATC